MVYPTSAKSNLSSQRASPPPSQSSLILAFNLDDDNFEPLWASASQPFQPYLEGPSQPVENDSPVEEVEPVQPKQKYTRRSKPTKKNDKEFVEPWTIEEEIALCKAFVAKSEDIVQGNGKKAAGFRREVVERFHEEIGEDKRSYDSVNCKWKKRIRPKVSQFCEIYNSVRDRHQSGSCDNTVYQEAECHTPKIGRQRNSNIGVRLQGTKSKALWQKRTATTAMVAPRRLKQASAASLLRASLLQAAASKLAASLDIPRWAILLENKGIFFIVAKLEVASVPSILTFR
ncbi:hypothetical protein Tco_0831087 [Tanacetum coccineum]